MYVSHLIYAYKRYQVYIHVIKEEKRVSNVLRCPCSNYLESNITSRLAHLTKLRCCRLDFSQECEESKAFFVSFMLDSS